MDNSIQKYNPQNESVVIYQSEDGLISLDVQLADETVWLNQQQMVTLFDTTKPNVSMHIRNIFTEGELDPIATVKDFLTVQTEGGRTVTRSVKYYNLDVIISIGYRVKSQRGTRFRQWANRVLKEYLLQGYSVNGQLLAMQRQIDSRFQQQQLYFDNRLTTQELRLNEHQQQIDFFVKAAIPPLAQIFYNGEFFEARFFLEKLIKTATKRIVIIDNYIDAATFDMLDVRAKGVTADIYSGKDYTALRDLHNAKPDTEPINTYLWSNPSHDRWLLIDNKAYHCGHSLKDMGQKLSAASLIESITAEDILKQVR